MHDGCPIGGHAVFGPRHIVRRPIRPLDGQDDAPVGREGNLTRRRLFPGDGLSVLLVDEVPDRLRIVQVAHRELDAGLAGT